MGVSIYDQIYPSINGVLLSEATTVKLEYEGDDQDILTLAKGWAGQTPAPRSIKVTIDEFVPRTGFEFDFIKKYLNSEIVTLGLQFGGSGVKMTSDGFLRTPGVEAGAGQSTKATIMFKGEAKNFV